MIVTNRTLPSKSGGFRMGGRKDPTNDDRRRMVFPDVRVSSPTHLRKSETSSTTTIATERECTKTITWEILRFSLWIIA